MMWHCYLMILISVLYIIYKIYVYSTSLTFNYWKTKEVQDWDEWKWFKVKCRRRRKELKYILKSYFDWYGFKHFYPVIIAWLIYGGIFIW